MRSAKKISPLIVILLCAGAITAGVALSNWYWSKTLTHTITIEGTVTAISNFDYEDLADSPDYATLVSRSVSTLLPWGGDYYARLVTTDSNLVDCYLKINVTCPEGVSVTAEVCAGVYQNGGFNGAEVLATDVACDGSELVKIARNGDDQWFFKSDYVAGIYNMVYIRFDFVTDDLSVGEHVFNLTLELGS